MIYWELQSKPPSTKPPINRHPRDGGGCHSVTHTCPNASEAHPMLLRYEQRRRWEVNDFWWVDIWKVIGLSGTKVVGFGYSPWRWYRGVTEVWDIHMNRGSWGGEQERRGEVRKQTDVPLQLAWASLTVPIHLQQQLSPLYIHVWTSH
jgi:hypothetical protein